MANPAHLQILRQGVEAWNQWRDENRDIPPDLSGATLTRATLTGADLFWATLTGADVSEARLCETVFGDTDLTTVRGLDTCGHVGPSTLDHRTLAQSGPLPLAFLRGCGLPDALIEYLPSLLGEAIQYDSLFISYANQDRAFAERGYPLKAGHRYTTMVSGL